MLSELEKFNVQTILVLYNKKWNGYKIFHSWPKVIASDSNIDETFRSMHQSIMAKIKNHACKDWIVLHVIITHSITVFKC